MVVRKASWFAKPRMSHPQQVGVACGWILTCVRTTGTDVLLVCSTWTELEARKERASERLGFEAPEKPTNEHVGCWCYLTVIFC